MRGRQVHSSLAKQSSRRPANRRVALDFGEPGCQRTRSIQPAHPRGTSTRKSRQGRLALWRLAKVRAARTSSHRRRRCLTPRSSGEPTAGPPTLHTDEGHTRLSPGMCEGFKAGTGNGHGLFSKKTVGCIECQTLFKYPRTSPKPPWRVSSAEMLTEPPHDQQPHHR